VTGNDLRNKLLKLRNHFFFFTFVIPVVLVIHTALISVRHNQSKNVAQRYNYII